MIKNPAKCTVRLVVTIVDRGQGKKVVEIFRDEQVYLQFVCLGHGTASSEILDYLGLGETEKEIVISLVTASRAPALLDVIGEKMRLTGPGKGIAFSVPLTGISLIVSQLVTKEQNITEGESRTVDCHARFGLIIAVVNQGYTEEVMTAAKKAGATGGTVVPARGINNEEVEKFLGISIQAEKEIVAILARKEDKQSIMQAIAQAAGLKTPSRGIVFSLPVENILGLS